MNNIFEILLKIRRVTKVTRGGRNFGFSACAAWGDGRGFMGCGFGKGKDVMEAKRKAMQSARRHSAGIALRDDRTIYRNIESYFKSSKIIMMPSSPGTGLIANGIVRSILQCTGIKDAVVKTYGSRNPINVAQCVVKGLRDMESPKMIAMRRGKYSASDILPNYNKFIG